MVKLSMLDITGANSTSIPETILDEPLVKLSWSNNALTSLPIELFEMPMLETLYCFNNSITSLRDGLAGNWSASLENVYLNGNPLQSLPMTVISNTTSIADCFKTEVFGATVSLNCVWTILENTNNSTSHQSIKHNWPIEYCFHCFPFTYSPKCGLGDPTSISLLNPRYINWRQFLAVFVLHRTKLEFFEVYNREVSLLTTFLLGLMHLHGIYMVFKPIPMIRRYDIKILQWYRFFFGRYGPFGLYGQLYLARVRVKLLYQLPLHMYRAYRMSCLFTTPISALISSVLLAVNVRNPFARQWLPAILDAVIDFALSSGIPIALVFQSVAGYYIHADKDIAANHVWLDRNVLLG
ncbi:hypothetical protein THRCLA_02532 [Thraustotheca clavata]|uniref:Uncharacterized protein n=1 Tax=Thraustotheca clavata TaxID=74557 RepID=A0A1W0A4W4_9STRA|nr:hypothetical protein THRCLA_02532 [Thraustotheca clavata]